MRLPVNAVGTFNAARATATFGTTFASLVPPWNGPYNGEPFMYGLLDTRANWYLRPRPIITSLLYTTSTNVKTITILRPKNWTTVASAAVKNQAVINITADPGIYSTKYKYPTPPGFTTGTATAADNGIAANDYCVYQLKDGTWIMDTVASVATLAITMTTVVPNITGGGVAAGAPFFFFGVTTNVDPATGLADPTFITTATTARENVIGDTVLGGVGALHGGDPLIIYSSNSTEAGVLEGAYGYYQAAAC